MIGRIVVILLLIVAFQLPNDVVETEEITLQGPDRGKVEIKEIYVPPTIFRSLPPEDKGLFDLDKEDN